MTVLRNSAGSATLNGIHINEETKILADKLWFYHDEKENTFARQRYVQALLNPQQEVGWSAIIDEATSFRNVA